MFDIFSSVRKNHSDEPFQVTRQTVIGDILDLDNSTAPYFMEIGMHCLGCPASQMETLEEAAMVHGIDSDLLVEKINAAMNAAAQ